jgi:hypothetical protein
MSCGTPLYLLAGLDIQQSQAAATQPCHLSSRCVLHIYTTATAARPAAKRFQSMIMMLLGVSWCPGTPVPPGEPSEAVSACRRHGSRRTPTETQAAPCPCSLSAPCSRHAIDHLMCRSPACHITFTSTAACDPVAGSGSARLLLSVHHMHMYRSACAALLLVTSGRSAQMLHTHLDAQAKLTSCIKHCLA